MKKSQLCVLLLVFGLTTNCQNELTGFKNSSTANEPNLKLNSSVIISTNVAAKNGDFVAYDFEDTFSGKHKRIHRLVAQENDIIEIKNGLLYINKTNDDANRNLIHFYLLPKKDYLDIKRKEKMGDEFMAMAIGSDSVQAMLESRVAKDYDWEAQRKIVKPGEQDNAIKSIFMQNWNMDNFGPLTIPKNKVFVLGDNRHNSEDSRYIGLIDKSQILGVVVVKE